MKKKYSRTEEFKVAGSAVVKKIKQLVKEGNIRRIIIQNESGEVLVEFPLTVAVVGTVIAPILSAVGALTALVSNCTIVIEKK